jgi:hypothetical protein
MLQKHGIESACETRRGFQNGAIRFFCDVMMLFHNSFEEYGV